MIGPPPRWRSRTEPNFFATRGASRKQNPSYARHCGSRARAGPIHVLRRSRARVRPVGRTRRPLPVGGSDTAGGGRVLYARMGSRAEMLVADARLAECLVHEGCLDEALELTDDALTRVHTLGGGFGADLMLERVRGWALIRSGSVEKGRDLIVECLRQARERNLQYETALALDLLASVTQDKAGTLRHERDEILSRFGVSLTLSHPSPTPT